MALEKKRYFLKSMHGFHFFDLSFGCNLPIYFNLICSLFSVAKHLVGKDRVILKRTYNLTFFVQPPKQEGYGS